MSSKTILLNAMKNLPTKNRYYFAKYDSSSIAGKVASGKFELRYVMVHHTAGLNSYGMLASGVGHKPVPGANFLVDKDGDVHLLSIFQTYHAGLGSGWGVPTNTMNPYAVGIEVESLGKTKDFTTAQKESLGALIAGLLDGMGKSNSAIINHNDWSSTGKVDSRYSRSEISSWVDAYRKGEQMPNVTVYLDQMKYGQKNSDSVRELQKALNNHSMPPNGRDIAVTGNYDNPTDQEVRLCQSLHGFGDDPNGGSYLGPKQAEHLMPYHKIKQSKPVEEPTALTSRGSKVEAAIAALQKATGGGDRGEKIKLALDTLLSIKLIK